MGAPPPPAGAVQLTGDGGEYEGEWTFEPQLLKTPSAADGVTAETEARYRREGCKFIKDVAVLLSLHMNVYNTGSVFFHRFYLKHSFKKYPRYYMAAACLFVAGKVEEQPKKLKDLLPKVFDMYPRKQQPGVAPPVLGQKTLSEMKTQVLANERALLQTLDFDFVVKHGPKFLFQYAKALRLESGEKVPNQLVQLAYRYISDTYQTVMCLEYRAALLAVALLQLATKMLKLSVTVADAPAAGGRGGRGAPAVAHDWWERFVPGSSEQMPEIHQKMLQYYESIGESLQSVAQPALQALTPGLTPTSASSPGTPSSAAPSPSERDRAKSSSKLSADKARSRRQRARPY